MLKATTPPPLPGQKIMANVQLVEQEEEEEQEEEAGR